VRVGGLDLSMGSTGLTLIEDVTNDAGDPWWPNVRVNRIRSRRPVEVAKGEQPTLLQRHQRNLDVERQIADVIGHPAYRGPIEVLLIEAPAYNSNNAYANELAELRGRVLSMLLGWDIPMTEVISSTLKLYATGSGATRDRGEKRNRAGVVTQTARAKVSKDDVVRAAKDNYPVSVAQQIDGHDAADSLILAAMAARYVGHPIEARELPAASLAAVDVIRWPERIPE
jgi:crossover junction endodeoxyribonuclease RuvC